MDKRIHKRPLNKRQISTKVNTLIAESKKLQERRKRKLKRKKKTSPGLEKERDEILKKSAPIMRELLTHKRKDPDNEWLKNNYRKSHEILTILEVGMSPLRFMGAYGAPVSTNGKGKRQRPGTAKHSIDEVVEEKSQHKEKKVESIHTDLRGLIASLNENPDNELSFKIVKDLYQESLDMINEQARENKFGKGKRYTGMKRKRRENKIFNEEIFQIHMRRLYGTLPDVEYKLSYQSFGEQSAFMKKLEEHDAEKTKKLVDILREKKVKWLIQLEGRNGKGGHLGIIARDLIGGKELDNGVQRKLYAASFFPEQYHCGMFEDKEYRKQYIKNVVALFRTPKFRKRTGYKTIVMICDKEKLDDKFLKEIDIIHIYEVPLKELTLQYYGINLQEPYQGEMDVEKVVEKDGIPIQEPSDFGRLSSPMHSFLYSHKDL